MKLPSDGSTARAIYRNVKALEKDPKYGINGTKGLNHAQRVLIAYRFAKASQSRRIAEKKKETPIPAQPAPEKTPDHVKKRCECWMCR